MCIRDSVSGYVELEFTEAVPGFWGMRFPGERIGPAVVAPAAGATPKLPEAKPAARVEGFPTLQPGFSNPSPAPVASSERGVASTSVEAAKLSTAVISPVAPATSLPAAKLPTPISKPAPAPLAPTGSSFATQPDASVSSSASNSAHSLSSVLSLPRASDGSVSPLAVVQHPESTPAAAENSNESLKAENARLQSQLTALLFADKQKSPQASPASQSPAGAASVERKPLGEAASKILDLPATVSNIASPAKRDVTKFEPPTLDEILSAAIPAAPPVATSGSKVPPTPVAVKPPAPAKPVAATLRSLSEDEEVKIPTWLEPLARNAAIRASAEESSADTAVFDARPGIHNEELSSSPVSSADLTKEAEAHEPMAQELPSVDDAAGDDAGSDEVSSVAAPNFGSRLLIDEEPSGTEGVSRINKTLIFAIAAAFLLAVFGGLWYTPQGGAILKKLQSFTQSNSAAPQSVATPAPAQNSASGSTPVKDAQVSASARSNPGAAHTATDSQPIGVIKNQAATPAALNANLVVNPERTSPAASGSTGSIGQPAVNQPATAAQKRPSLGEVRLTAPTVIRKGDAASLDASDPAIAVNGSTAPDDASMGSNFASSSGPAVPSVPVPIGGDVKAAHLVKSVPPVYPAFAKTQRVGGDVKIDALIDASGKVTSMKVVGGPVVLHQAAMEALRQWKYQPATLDGKAIPMHLTVCLLYTSRCV